MGSCKDDRRRDFIKEKAMEWRPVFKPDSGMNRKHGG